MFPKLYFITKALHIRAVISNGHYANETWDWEHAPKVEGVKIQLRHLSKIHFSLLRGVDPQCCYICQLHDSAANPTNLLITHNWFHITHQFGLDRLGSVRTRLGAVRIVWAVCDEHSKSGQWKRNLPILRFLFALVCFLRCFCFCFGFGFIASWRRAVKVICRHKMSTYGAHVNQNIMDQIRSNNNSRSRHNSDSSSCFFLLIKELPKWP